MPFGGHEHDHELGRGVELRLVALGGELGDVLARLARVVGERGVALVVGLGLLGGEEGVEGDLGVHDHELAAGQAHEDVGAQTPVVGMHGGLGGEVAVLDHAGHLDDVAQLDLAPRAAGRRAPQRRAQAPGLLGQTVDAGQQRTQRLAQAPVGLATLALERVDLALHLPELVTDGLDDPLDLLGAPAKLPGRPLLIGEALRGVLARRAPRPSSSGRRPRPPARRGAAARGRRARARRAPRQPPAASVLLGARREALLQPRDLGLVALPQRAELEPAHGGGARELGLARDPVADP